MTHIRPRIERFQGPEQLSRAAAEQFVRLARENIALGGKFTVALSGGSTPHRLYQLLAEPFYQREVDWNRVECFWGDERTVPPDHPDSNFNLVYHTLLEKLPCPEKRIHRFKVEIKDRQKAARDYQEEIARLFGVPEYGEPPALDLILLGLGVDGHTASLFPYTEAVRETRRWVTCHYVPALKTDRFTLTAPILNRGKTVLFLVSGQDKANALQTVLNGPTDPEQFPAQLIHPIEGQLIWMVDEAAASQLVAALKD